MTSTPSTASATNSSSFFPDFGLSALSSLTQIAKMTQQVKDIQNAQKSTVGSSRVNIETTSNVSSSPSIAQTLSNQNLASLGSLSLEAFKQVTCHICVEIIYRPVFISLFIL